MERIEELTPEQEAQIRAVQNVFLQIQAPPRQADYSAAERAVKDAYRAVGLKPPKHVSWMASPGAAATAAALLASIGVANVRAKVWNEPKNTLLSLVTNATSPRVEKQLVSLTEAASMAMTPWTKDQLSKPIEGSLAAAEMRNTMRDYACARIFAVAAAQLRKEGTHDMSPELRSRLMGVIREQVFEPLFEAISEIDQSAVNDMFSVGVWPLYESESLARVAYLPRVFGLPGAEKVEPLTRIATYCGWVWFFEDVTLITYRSVGMEDTHQERNN